MIIHINTSKAKAEAAIGEAAVGFVNFTTTFTPLSRKKVRAQLGKFADLPVGGCFYVTDDNSDEVHFECVVAVQQTLLKQKIELTVLSLN